MKQHYLPTPEQIKAECERIRSTWDENERRLRKGNSVRNRGFGLKVVDTSNISNPAVASSIDDELYCWHYIDDCELERDQRRLARRRARLAASLPENQPEEELIDDSTVEAVVVEFGD